MIELVTEYFLAIALFFSFITLIFYGFPVAWTMGGLGVIFIIISMLSDSLFDTFYGVDWGFASMVVYRLYGVMANWVLVALPMFIFMGIMMDKSGIAEDLMTDLSKLFGRTRGGLSVLDFLKIQTVIEYKKSGLRKISKSLKVLTDAEDLPNHYKAVKRRLD